MRKFARISTALVFVSSPLLSLVGHAGTDTANLTVSASVTENCTITTAPLAFGAYDPADVNLSSALVGSGTVTVLCTSGAATVIELNEGANENTGSTLDVPLRRLISGANYLSYDLFSNVGRTVVWATGEAVDVAHTGTGTSTDLTVYGSIPGAQNVPVGSYSDTVLATVTF